MPGQQLQTTGVVLNRQPGGSDTFEQITVFSEEHGVLLCLRRLPRKAAGHSSPLDLFDEAELSLESSNEGRTWFIREHRHLTRRPGLGRSYEALQTAARISGLLTRNPVPDESRQPVALLLRQSLDSLETGGRPDIVWVKALYRFLREEGYPVKQDWWQQLPPADRDLAAPLLNRPLAEQSFEPSVVHRIAQRLEQWVRGDTEIKI
jgi:recombinational DNA repair protein (RecF pathway)